MGRGMKMNDVIGNGAPVGVALCAAAYAPDNAFALLILMAAVLALYVFHQEHEQARVTIMDLCTDLAKNDERLKDLTLQIKKTEHKAGGVHRRNRIQNVNDIPRVGTRHKNLLPGRAEPVPNFVSALVVGRLKIRIK